MVSAYIWHSYCLIGLRLSLRENVQIIGAVPVFIVENRSISIVLPTYNEKENIEQMVKNTTHFLESLFEDWEIIIVNDGSQDRTGEIIDRLAQRDPTRLVALHHTHNRGYGAALTSGIQQARKELIFFCDADLQFHPNELLLLLLWIEQYDLIIGYRAKRRDPQHRLLNAYGWHLLVSLLLGLRVRDIDCAFKLFRREVFQAIKIDAVGAMVNTDILVQATRMGFKIKEVPVTHFPRQHGAQTGANLRVIRKAFAELLHLYSKLRHIHPLVTGYDRRHHQTVSVGSNQRQGERRMALLPINFSDRRRRFLQLNGSVTPMSSATSSSQVLYDA